MPRKVDTTKPKRAIGRPRTGSQTAVWSARVSREAKLWAEMFARHEQISNRELWHEAMALLAAQRGFRKPPDYENERS